LALAALATPSTLETTGYAPPPRRSRGVMVKDAAELVAALKQKGLI
jgi:electron transfer flavoprotein beta subunit